MMRLLRPFITVAALAGGIGLAYAANPLDLSIPQIGEPADLSLSPRQEVEIGKNIVGQLYGAGFILEDPQLTEYMTSMGWRLAEHSPERPAQLQFFLVRDGRINAFALPGGFIGLNTGLLIAAQSESEVAGVLSHELAHVTQRHIARTIEGTKGTNLATWATVLGAILLGSASPDLIIAALSLGQGISYQNQVNYTRGHELEADRLGIRTLASANFNPEGMAAFFQRLEQQSRLYGEGLPEILRTHPVNTTRIAEARTRAREYQDVKPQEDTLEFGFMRSRAAVLTASRPSDALAQFLRAIDKGGDNSPANRYGAALANMQLGQIQKAREFATPLIEEFPRNPTVGLLAADIESGGRQYETSNEMLKTVLEYHPRSIAAQLNYAINLVNLDQPEQARQFLLDRDRNLNTEPLAQKLLAEIAESQNEFPEVAYRSALFSFQRGDSAGAMRKITVGLRNPAVKGNDRAKMEALRIEVRATLPKNWRPEPVPGEERERF